MRAIVWCFSAVPESFFCGGQIFSAEPRTEIASGAPASEKLRCTNISPITLGVERQALLGMLSIVCATGSLNVHVEVCKRRR